MESEIIEVTSINDEVYSRLRHQITHAKIVPGERISIRQIAEAFGVSTMPVREALRKLQAEGFVQFETRSLIVRQLSSRELTEIFSIRLKLEILAYEWALPHVNEEDINNLKIFIDSMDDENIESGYWQQLNREFHFQFYNLSASPMLIQFIKSIWDMVEPYMHICPFSTKDLQLAQIHHREILHFIEEKNLPALIELTETHLKSTCNFIIDELGETFG
jgi:DNA-binding GntR family transcriptional regulator